VAAQPPDAPLVSTTDGLRYELWDASSGNIIDSLPSLTELVQSAFALGQANPDEPVEDMTARAVPPSGGLGAAFREARRLTKSALDGEGCTEDWWQGTEAMAVWLEHALAVPQR
jgi:hypothetical protein